MEFGLPEVITDQSIFDKVTRHLFEQRIRCLNFVGQCSLRGGPNNELACAFGCLIPNGHHVLESAGVATKSTVKSVSPDLLPHQQLIYDLQVIHDGDENNHRLPLRRDYYKKFLIRCAAEHNLDATVVMESYDLARGK